MLKNDFIVILSEAKNLMISACFNFEILRLTPQNDNCRTASKQQKINKFKGVSNEYL